MPLFEIHIPILDDIKEKGLAPTLKDTTDDVVERITSGLRIADIRSVLRDDPRERPDPRLKPHSEGFWLHMRHTITIWLTAFTLHSVWDGYQHFSLVLKL